MPTFNVGSLPFDDAASTFKTVFENITRLHKSDACTQNLCLVIKAKVITQTRRVNVNGKRIEINLFFLFTLNIG